MFGQFSLYCLTCECLTHTVCQRAGCCILGSCYVYVYNSYLLLWELKTERVTGIACLFEHQFHFPAPYQHHITTSSTPAPLKLQLRCNPAPSQLCSNSAPAALQLQLYYSSSSNSDHNQVCTTYTKKIKTDECYYFTHLSHFAMA